MSEYHFGLGSSKLTKREQKKRRQIAAKYGATFTFMHDANGKPRYWFSCPNYGSPYDGNTQHKVMAELN